MTRRRSAALLAPALAGALLVVVAGCGKKGPPLAPLQVTPARIEDLTARRLGDDVYLRFSVPATNSDGKRPAEVTAVEVLALTGEPVDVNGDSLVAQRLLQVMKPVARLEVQPPPPPETAEERERRIKAEDERRARGEPPPPPPSPPPPDPRPKQGDPVTVVEAIGPSVLTPYVPTLGRKRQPPPAPPIVDERQWPMPPVHVEAPPLRRVYVAVGRNRKGRPGPPSARVGVPLFELPPPPLAPTVRHTETSIVVEWGEAPGARLPVLQPSGDPDEQPVRLLMPGRPAHAYNVYDSAGPGQVAGGAATAPAPLNPAPQRATVFEDARLQFGVERCYLVRTVEAAGIVTVESVPSPMACITPVDVFPPAAPRSLAAVGSEGAINLIWEPNTEGDLAGYLVLRAEADGRPLAALTPAPVKETTYRDAAVVAGTRYVYAVVAVDTATPQNVSVESNRVEETAR